jgi:sporulation protein YlmC with PRC-barrel domain
MAETATFTIGARVNCSDGFCGELSRIVLDPQARKATRLVVDPEHRHEPGRLVPLRFVDEAAGEIRLRCTIAEFESFEQADVLDLAPDEYQGGYGSDAVEGYGNVGSMGVGGSISGMGIGQGLGHGRRAVSHENLRPNEAAVRHGDRVHATDGEIGKLEGFRIDPGDQELTHLLLQEGHIWGRKEVAVPISAVTELDDGIRLNLSKQQVEDLPPVS